MTQIVIDVQKMVLNLRGIDVLEDVIRLIKSKRQVFLGEGRVGIFSISRLPVIGFTTLSELWIINCSKGTNLMFLLGLVGVVGKRELFDLGIN